MAAPRISEDEIIQIQTLYHDQNKTIPEVHEITGKSTGTIDKYIHEERVKPSVPTVPKHDEPYMDTDETKKVTLVAAEQPCPNCKRIIPADSKICPYCGQSFVKEEEPTQLGFGSEPSLEPWDWYKKFLEQYARRYGVKQPFIELQCDRVRMRNGELPSPAQLTKDLTIHQQNMKVDTASYIAEIYGVQLNEYLNRRKQLFEYWQQPYQGVQMPAFQPRQPYQGISTGQPTTQPSGGYQAPQPSGGGYQGIAVPMPGQQPQQQWGVPSNNPQQWGMPQNNPSMYPPTIQQQLRDYVEMDRLIHGTQEATPNPDVERMARELEEMRKERKEDKEREIESMRMQIQQDHDAKQRLSDSIRQYEDKLRSAETKALLDQSNKHMTKEDVQMKEIDTKFNLETKKLEEGGKTREAIAGAVKTGFQQVGQAIFATAQEIGSEETRPMQGFSDTKNMWQSECPYCSTTITAPLSAKVITCPGCNRQLEVTAQATQPGEQRRVTQPTQPTRPIEQPTQKDTPPTEQPPGASFTVEQPPIKEPIQPPPKFEAAPRISDCPFCKTPLTIPSGLDTVECPKCKKILRVGTPEKEPSKELPPGEVVTGTEAITDQKIEQPIVPEERRDIPIHKPEPSYVEIPKEDEQPPENIEQKQLKDDIHKLYHPSEEKTTDVEKIAEGIAIGEGVKKIEEEISKTPGSANGNAIYIEKDFVCGECGKGFDTEPQLQGHTLHHIQRRGKGKNGIRRH